MWLAGNQRERLIQAARTMRSLPDVRNRPVTSLVRSAPLFCEPDTPIREAAKMLMAEAGRSALLVRLRDGLGIVTDVDFRDKVVRLRHLARGAGDRHHDDAGAHHRRRGARARGQHRHDGRAA